MIKLNEDIIVDALKEIGHKTANADSTFAELDIRTPQDILELLEAIEGRVTNIDLDPRSLKTAVEKAKSVRDLAGKEIEKTTQSDVEKVLGNDDDLSMPRML